MNTRKKMINPTANQMRDYLQELSEDECTCTPDQQSGEDPLTCPSCTAAGTLNDISQKAHDTYRSKIQWLLKREGKVIENVDFPDPCPDCGDKYSNCVCAWRRAHGRCPWCGQLSDKAINILNHNDSSDLPKGVITP